MEATEFERHRKKLFAIAYRMSGSAAEAEDIVQDAWIRWSATNRRVVDDPEAFLTRITTRLCLDHLKSARVQREEYVGPWLPEPILTIADSDDPESRHETAELVSIALLRLMEELSPVERATLLLHDVFHYDHSEIAGMLDITSAAARQALSRARRRLPDRKKRFAPTPDAQNALVERFVRATAEGDLEGLQLLLAGDVIARSDGGGKVTAARRPIVGPEAVSKFFAGIGSKAPDDSSVEIRSINGSAGLLIYIADELFAVFSFEFDRDRIAEVSAVLNPEKLESIRRQIAVSR